MLDLAIVIVNYNTAELLQKCLESVFCTNFDRKFEVFVIDNNSTDNSVEMVQKKFPNVKLIKNEKNIGLAKANNKGIELSDSKYILFLNPDIIVRKYTLNKLIQFMENNPECGILGCKLLNPDGSLQLSCRTFPSFSSIFFKRTFLRNFFPGKNIVQRYLMGDWDHLSTKEIDWLFGASLMVRRETINEVGGMDENYFLYFEDVDWCYRMKLKKWKVYYYPGAEMIHHHQRESAKGLSNMALIHIKSYLYFLRKHGLFYKRRIYNQKEENPW